MIVEGLREFQGKISSLPKHIQVRADAYVKDGAAEWEGLAKRSAPNDQGALIRNISYRKLGEAHYEVISASEYSAFLEWGTKIKVNVPSDLMNYASQFRGAKGTDAKKFIYAWCKRVGIDPKYWFVVYRKIMVSGINPHPYFFIHKPIIENKLNTRLKGIFK